MKKKKIKKAIISQEEEVKIIETSSWEDVFYLIDLNNGTFAYRKENEEPWYNLRIRPNSIRPESRHYTMACGSNYEKMLNCVSKHISIYGSFYEYLESLDQLSDSGRVGRISLGYADDYWEAFGESEYITDYDEDIAEAIKKGKSTRIIIGSHVKVMFNESEDEFEIKGSQAEWFENFIDLIMGFDGHTKIELLDLLSDDIDTYCLNEIFASLKKIGCYCIRDMKEINMYQWLEILTPIVNEWSFDIYDDVEEEE